MAKRRGDGDLPPTKKWAALGFFLVGVAFVLLFVFGPEADGRGEVLKIIGGGLIGVAVYLFAGINLPAVDWGGIAVRVLTALLNDEARKGDGR